MKPNRQPVAPARRVSTRLHPGRPMDQAFLRLQQEILDTQGTNAAGDFTRQCLLTGFALHKAALEDAGHPPPPELAVVETAVTQTPAAPAAGDSAHTQQNNNAVAYANDSGVLHVPDKYLATKVVESDGAQVAQQDAGHTSVPVGSGVRDMVKRMGLGSGMGKRDE